MKMTLFILFIVTAFASEEYKIVAESGPKSRADFVQKEDSPQYIGVTYQRYYAKWRAERWSKNENRMLYNGWYDNKEIAAHMSDTLARKLMKNGERDHKLNFPQKKNTSKYIGLSYIKNTSKWCVRRKSKNEKKMIYNGYYDNEETAAHASDTLARKLMDNGERGHKLNFPCDETEVQPERKKSTTKYFGVTLYNRNKTKWCSFRWSKNEKKTVSNGYYDNEETAAHASDTLARKLMDNGERGHKLNFPDEDTEIYAREKRYASKYFGVNYNKCILKWCSCRWSKNKNKTVYNRYYDNEETAAHASDNLARNLMKNGEHGHKLNFPDDLEVCPEDYPKKKRKTSDSLGYPQDK